MKNLSLLATALLIPFGVVARGLPKSRIAEDDDGTIPQLTRITAIIVSQQKVQCWEVSDTTAASKKRGKGASKGAVHGTNFGSTDESDLEDVNIFSWGPHGTIFDSADEYSATASIFSGYSFFRVLGGILSIETSFNASAGGAHAQIEGYENHVFADENGDDWFYFEDTTRADIHKSDDDDITPGIVMTADSGGNTQLLQITHSNRPSYKKVHDGPCAYTGVRTPPPTKGPSAAKTGAGGAHIDVSLTVQEL